MRIVGSSIDRLDTTIVAVFVATIVVVTSFLFSGEAWVMLDQKILAFWMNLLITPTIAVESLVLTYAVVKYSQEPRFRELAIGLIALNLILTSILNTLTNAAAVDWSPFADRNRNRTIIAALGFVLAPMPLLGSFSDATPVPRRQRDAVLAFGGIITPTIALLFFFSPQPVFITKPENTGLESFSLQAAIIVILVIASMMASTIKLMKAWSSHKNRVDLAFSLSMLLWILATLLITLQTNPFQKMEILFTATTDMGIALIALAVVVTAVVEPHKELKQLVLERTAQLDYSRLESEYFLNVWSHRVGNMLQGMMTYLELSEDALRRQGEQKLIDSAMNLTREVVLVNRQVSTLVRLRGDRVLPVQPMAIAPIFGLALQSVKGILGEEPIRVETRIPAGAVIQGSDLVEEAIANLLVFLIRSRETPRPTISVTTTTGGSTTQLEFACAGPELPADIAESLFGALRPEKTSLSLDLFLVKTVMEKLGGALEYRRLAPGLGSLYVLRFVSAT